MAHIVIDARELNTTTGRYITKLLEYLQNLDKTNNYSVLLYPKDLETWEPTNDKFVKVACKYKEFSFSEQLGMLLQLKKLRPDLVHFGMVQQPVLYRGRVVTTMHDLTTARFKNPSKNWLVYFVKQTIYKQVNRIVAKKSDMIITPSEYVKDDVAKYAKINSRKITVTYEAADKISDEPVAVEELKDSSFIFYVGRPMPHKNLYRLVSAFALLKKANPKLILAIVGRKDVLLDKLEDWCLENNIKNVVFTGYTTEGQLRWLYENTRAYVFPSLSEGFGLPGLEAMAHGAPVVSSSATCLPEIYGDAVEYFDPLNIDDISEKINKVISSKRVREDLINRGAKQVKKYSWETMAEETLAIYKEVLG